MNELVKALMKRLVPGEGPPMEVPPPPSVMAPGTKPRDPRDLEGIQKGFDRGMLGNFLALPDLVTAGVNKTPGFAGLLTRGAFGRQKLPSDAAAEGMGLAGSGAGYELGRAGADVAGMAMGMAGLKHKPVAGQANMWLSPLAPGFDKEKGKALVRDMRASRAVDPKLANSRKYADTLAQGHGMLYDPAARTFLQPMPEIKDWRVDPELRRILAQTPEGIPFSDLFTKSVNMNKLPEAVKGAVYKFDPALDFNTWGAYTPYDNRIRLGQRAFTSPEELKNTIFHEATHAGARSMGFSQGTAPENVALSEGSISRVDAKRYISRDDANKEAKFRKEPGLPVRDFDLPPKYRMMYSKDFANSQQAYDFSAGEMLAEESARMSRGEKPNLGLFSGKPLLKEHTPLPVADHLAEMKAKHPVLYKKLIARYPEMEVLYPNNALFRELLGGRPPLGVPDAPRTK